MSTTTCPLCNGKGILARSKLNKYRNEQNEYKKLKKDVSALTRQLEKYRIKSEINISDIKAEEREKVRRHYEPELIRLKEALDRANTRIKKVREEKQTPREQGNLLVEEFVEQMEDLYSDTEDEFETPENSNPDVIHIIKEGGRQIGKFIYELKDTKFREKDAHQLKNTADRLKADGKMLVVREMPKYLDGSHLATLDNEIVTQFPTSVAISRIFRDQFVRLRALGKSPTEAMEYIRDFLAKQTVFIEAVKEVSNNENKLLEEHTEFFERCQKHFDLGKTYLKANKTNLNKLNSAINMLGKMKEYVPTLKS